MYFFEFFLRDIAFLNPSNLRKRRKRLQTFLLEILDGPLSRKAKMGLFKGVFLKI